MYLFELTDTTDQDTLIKILTAVDVLKDGLDTGLITSNWDVDTLLKYFREYGVVLGPNDLYNMVQKKPLKNVVSNIEGSEVVFKGLPQQPKAQETPPPEQSKQVVAKMAKKAMK